MLRETPRLSTANHHVQPFSHQRRGFLAFYLYRDTLLDQETIVVLLIHTQDFNVSANPFTNPDRRQEADLVEAVIQAHHQVFGDNTLPFNHFGQQRKRQQTVGNRAAKRRLRRRLLIDMNKLVVLSAVGEAVDSRLVQGRPLAGIEFVAISLTSSSLGTTRMDMMPSSTWGKGAVS